MEIKRNVVSRFLLLWVVGMLLSVQVFAQGLTVKGVVKDNTGTPCGDKCTNKP